MVGSQIEVVMKDLENHFKNTSDTDAKLQIQLNNIIRKIYIDSINQNKGYCISFKNVESEVLNLFNILDLDQPKVSNAFAVDWKLPTTAHMINNPYYHILLIITAYSIRHKHEKLGLDALTLLFIKMWNGRKSRFIKYCDVDTMRYVIANLSGKFHAQKFDTPLQMITQHFAPTVLKKYSPYVERDVVELKRIFDQAFGRIRQLFVQGMKPDIYDVDGKSKATSGLSVFYHEAKAKGLSISSPKIMQHGDSENEQSELDMYTSSAYEEAIVNITSYIVINHNPKYEPAFINYVSSITKDALKQQLVILLSTIHNIRYTDHIKEILALMFKQLPIFNKTELCSMNFYEIVRRKIISSKHSTENVQIKQIADLLLEEIFKNDIKSVQYSTYSAPIRGKFRTIIFLGFAYNIQQYICKNL